MKKKFLQFFNFLKRNKKFLPIFLLVILFIPQISDAGIWSSILGSLGDAIFSFFLFFLGAIQWGILKVLEASTYILDNFLFITISPLFYDLDFVKLGWGVLRDLANVAFIIGIIVIGFYMILGKAEGQDGWKRMLLNLIIAALVMNFSLFIGRIIIDMGNFTAAVFYRATDTPDISKNSDERTFGLANLLLYGEENNDISPWYGKKSFATTLLIHVDPMIIPKVINEKVKDAFYKDVETKNNAAVIHSSINGATTSADTAVGQGGASSENDSTGGDKELKSRFMTLLSLIISIYIFSKLTKVFFVTSFTFLVRTGQLVIALIKAPIYFAWSFLPTGENAFKKWFTDIFTKSFCIALFTAGLWILLMLLGNINNLLKFNTDNQTIVLALVFVAAKMILVVGSLEYLGKQTIKLCEGEGRSLGDRVWSGLVSKALPLAGTFTAMAVSGPWGAARRFGRRVQSTASEWNEEWDREHRHSRAQRNEWESRNESQKIDMHLDDQRLNAQTENIREQSQESSELHNLNENVERVNKNLKDKRGWKQEISYEEIDKAVSEAAGKTKMILPGIQEQRLSDIVDKNARTKQVENIMKQKPKPTSLEDLTKKHISENISTSAARAIDGRSVQTPKDISKSLIDSLRKATDKKETKSASEIISEKQNTTKQDTAKQENVIINTQGANIRTSGTTNITSEKEKFEAEKMAETAKSEAKIDSAVAGELPKPKSRLGFYWKKSKGAMGEKLKSGVSPLKNIANKVMESVEKDGLLKATGKAAGKTVLKGVLKTAGIATKGVELTAKATAKTAEKSFEVMDTTMASDESLKAREARISEKKREYENLEKRQKDAREKLNQLRQNKEDTEIKLKYAKSEKEKKEAELKLRRLKKELKNTEKVVKKGDPESFMEKLISKVKKMEPETAKEIKVRSGNINNKNQLNKIAKEISKMNKNISKKVEKVANLEAQEVEDMREAEREETWGARNK